jgi:hypothetical protein
VQVNVVLGPSYGTYVIATKIRLLFTSKNLECRAFTNTIGSNESEDLARSWGR